MDQRRSRKGGPTLPSGRAKSEPRVILNTSPYTGQVKRRSPIAPLNAPAAREALESGAATIDEAGNLLTVGERALMRELLAHLGDDA
jgi:hypothetical protein